MNAMPRLTAAHESGTAGCPTTVRIGFIPLVDCALPVVAAHKNFAAREGLRLELVRESSWANIRDRVVLGHFDAAHMLAPMPIAASLKIGHLTVPMAAPLALGLGGNAITVSTGLWRAMGRAPGAPPQETAAALAAVVAVRARAGQPPLTFAMVYPFSCHNYELRYWLASAGIHPDRDVRLVVVPPPLMGDALNAGQIDGFCVGEPWNSLAVAAGTGVIAATKAELWRHSPEKVLGLSAAWAERHPDRVAALIRALTAAAAWADDPAHHDELAELLADPAHVGAPAAVIAGALSGRLPLVPGGAAVRIPDFLVFSRSAATFPWASHALWFYSQMVRWGQTPLSAEGIAIARRTYRPDLYRAALKGTALALPSASMKVEGALDRPTPVASSTGTLVLGPDGFFDGRRFDPDQFEAYLGGFAIHSMNGPAAVAQAETD